MFNCLVVTETCIFDSQEGATDVPIDECTSCNCVNGTYECHMECNKSPQDCAEVIIREFTKHKTSNQVPNTLQPSDNKVQSCINFCYLYNAMQ